MMRKVNAIKLRIRKKQSRNGSKSKSAIDSTKRKYYLSEENKGYLKILKRNPKNIELYFKIVNHLYPDITFQKLKDGEQAAVITFEFAVFLLDEIFDILLIAYLFHHNPNKVIGFIKASIKQYDHAYAELFREIILLGLSDERRFEFGNNLNLGYIRKHITLMKIDQVQNDKSVDEDWLYLIDGKKRENWWEVFDSHTTRPTTQDQVLLAFVIVRGLTKMRIEEIREVFDKYPEDSLREAINRYGLTSSLDIPSTGNLNAISKNRVNQNPTGDSTVFFRNEKDQYLRGSLESNLTKTGNKILPYLIDKYGNDKVGAKEYVCLFWAMANLDLANREDLFGKSKISNTLKTIKEKFNSNFGRTPFNKALAKIREDISQSHIDLIGAYEAEIESLKKNIKGVMAE